jgi:hypothetical protein
MKELKRRVLRGNHCCSQLSTEKSHD